jgi:hypothetical protein
MIRIRVLTLEPYFLVRAGLGISYRQHNEKRPKAWVQILESCTWACSRTKEFFKLGIGKLNIGLSPAQ